MLILVQGQHEYGFDTWVGDTVPYAYSSHVHLWNCYTKVNKATGHAAKTAITTGTQWVVIRVWECDYMRCFVSEWY